MKKTLITLISFAILFAVNTTEASFKIIGYIPNWVNLQTFSDNFNYSRVTHLNIAFKDPNSAGDLPSLSSGELYLINAAHANGVKVLLSLCGGGSSSSSSIRSRYFNLISSANLQTFTSKLTQYAITNNLDGFDLDLEGSAINSDFGNFVQSLADSLHPIGKVVSAALSQGYGGSAVPDSTLEDLDWVNIMAYDYCGPTWGTPGQHSSYAFAVSNINYWTGRGLAKSKAILGVPFYGYGFGTDYSSSAYSFSYISLNYPDDIYDDQAGSTIWYNGIGTIQDKTILAKTSGGGIMIWDLSLDGTGNSSLLKYIRAAAGNAVTATTAESEDDKKLSVYPNPSSSVFTLQGVDLPGAKIEVYNSLGEKIETVLDGNSLDLSNKPKGLYYLHLVKDDKTTLRKIILQ